MKKHIFIKILVVFFLCVSFIGCKHKIDIGYDSQYGVRYDLKDGEKESFVLIKLDPENEDVVSMLRIWIDLDKNDEIKKESFPSTNASMNLIDDTYATYSYQEGAFYVINLNFYKDDELKTSISEEAKELIEYIGLTDELEDHILYYEEELKESQTFRYKYFIEQGIYNNNISLMQSEEYIYPQK